ncbi:MAG: polysaccharide biosynthesis protein [Leptospirales bacterium]|nr:polysaccharide biosynthesis protein [Leptospirales bacterium]
MLDWITKHRRFLILPVDAALTILAYFAANSLRFDQILPEQWEAFPGYSEVLRTLAVLVGCQLLALVFVGLYRSLWSYASIHDLVQILKGVSIGTLVGICALFLYNRLEGVSRSALVLDGVLLFLLISFRSFSWRIVRDLLLTPMPRNARRTLLVGAGLAAVRLMRELRNEPDSEYNPVGLVDDDRAKSGGLLQGLPVLGRPDDLPRLIRQLNIEAVLLTEKLPAARVRAIHRDCEEAGVSTKTLPPLRDMLNRPRIGGALRELTVEDLLGRDVVDLDNSEIHTALSGKTILITGAGGSIGSEVCRRLLQCQPAAMVLAEQAETALYEIDYELRNVQPPEKGARMPRIVSIIADIRDPRALDRIFREFEIQVVFHCAAYKHVPMMELNSAEAIYNNVIGTVRLAEAARDAGVDRFVMISTDKAVNPVNIMGASKRIAELYIQNLARTTDTCYITVRFGNVLGSSGSVIPLFSRQIAEGGPVTVTHPDIIRYFMTIPEAAGLVIQAGAMGKGGEIFILDMGEPVRIKDLAEDMIRFAGLVPHKDIEIRYVGLRPGEKLFEELLLDGEGVQPTHHRKIHIAMSRMFSLAELRRLIDELARAAARGDRMLIDARIADIVPEYKPVYSLGAQAELDLRLKQESSRLDAEESAATEPKEGQRREDRP